MEDVLNLAKDIKLLIFDVDGVLTDGTLYLTDENIEFKAFNSLDGLGIKLLLETGVEIAIITARKSAVVTARMQSLCIKHVYQCALDKIPAYNDLLKKLQLNDNQVAYMGDDLTDLPLIKKARLGIAPPNAIEFVKQQANYVTTQSGGKGAAREVCDLIMKAQGTLEKIYNRFL